MVSSLRSAAAAALLLFTRSVAAQTQTITAPATLTTSVKPSITAVSNCHPHGTVNWCMVGTDEYQVLGPTRTEEFQSRYTGCHMHGTQTYCVDSRGEDVQILITTTASGASATATPSATNEEPASTGEHCHFHAGVEHCVGGSESEEVTKSCDATPRIYNRALRIGLLFVILVTSAIGVYTPILTTRFNIVSQNNVAFVILKQFGTGIVISTAFVHLFTHAQLMFGNSCLGELSYEGTTAAIFMAGLVLSFLVDFLGARLVLWRQGKSTGINREITPADVHAKSVESSSSNNLDSEVNQSHGHGHGPLRVMTPMEQKINVWNLEAGIIFHSILIGITLVVAGDSFFVTLFIVILFHQMFEGIALGTCIAGLPVAAASTLQKLLMAGLFALITPIGMAIGIGVLNRFNGNNPSTIIAIGTLDALSAGILAWVGIVEMLAKDWLQGKLLTAGPVRTICAMIGLVSGLVLMSVLGKWA